MSLQEFTLPDVGEGLTEAEIISWKVKPGEQVALNQPIVEIETAKSLVELPCPFAGTVDQLLVAEGQTVEVGTPIIRVQTVSVSGQQTPGHPVNSDAAAPADAAGSGAAAPGTTGAGVTDEAGAADAGPAPQASGSLVGSGPAQESSKRRIRRFGARNAAGAAAASATSGSDLAAASAPSTLTAPSGSSGRAMAKPPVRKAAKDLGVSLEHVQATGSRGEVTRADLDRHVAGRASSSDAAAHAAAVAQAPAGGQAPASAHAPTQPAVTIQPVQPAQAHPSPHLESTRDLPTGAEFWVPQSGGAAREFYEPVRGVRKATAKAMVSSAFSAPHVSIFVDVDASRTMEFVKRLKESKDFEGIKVSPLLILAKAVIWATARNPQVNATWSDEDIIVHRYMNLGIAAATPRGLLVPNIKDAQDLSLKELAIALNSLAQTARAGQTAPSQMRGGTMTITNIGALGIDTGTPIINPGEVAIVAFGTIKQKPWVLDGEVIPRWVTTLGGSFDHRVVDGDLSARFMADVASILEEPALLLD